MRKSQKDEGRRKKLAVEGIVPQGRDGSPSGPTFAWKGGTGVSPVYVGKRGNLIDRLGATPQHTAGTAMPHSQTTGAAPAYALRDSGLASHRENGTPAARHPYPSFSKCAAAPLLRSVFSIVSRKHQPPLPDPSSVHSVCSVVNSFPLTLSFPLN